VDNPARLVLRAAHMYHVGRNGQQTGPYSIEQLKTMAARGELQPTDLVWQEGMAGWEPASTIPGVFGGAPAPMQASSPPLVQSTVLPPAGVPMPNNYLVFAILTTLCCCLPLGIPAIVFASQVNTKFAAGDLAGAMDSSNKAKMWCWIAFGCGLVAMVIWAIFYGVAMAAAVQEAARQEQLSQ
jgi:hypothetical protein